MALRNRFRFPLFLVTAILVGTACSTTGGTAAGDTTRRVYEVKDLVFGGPSGGQPWIALPDLDTNLKEATDPALWNRPGFKIQAEETGYLIVDADMSMQSKVAIVLSDIRSFATAKK